MNFWEWLRAAIAHDGLETNERFAIEQSRVDSVKYRQISGKLLQPLSELALGAGLVRLLVMMETDGKVNHPLQEQAPRATHGPPQVFEDLVAFEKRLPVE